MLMPEAWLPPVEHWLGEETKPNRKLPLLENAAPLPMVATIAGAISGPMPGTVSRRWACCRN